MRWLIELFQDLTEMVRSIRDLTTHVAMHSESPLVSIIIPVFNAEAYLAATLQSCLEQRYPNIEIIVINDGSTDGSSAILRDYDDARIRVIKTRNLGGCAARNTGIAQARGDLFQFLDHDDVLAPDKLERQVRQVQIHGSDWIYSGDMGSVSGDQREIDEGYELYQRDFSPAEYFQTVLSQYGKFLTTGVWLVPRERVQATHGWDARAGLNDDGEYFMRVLLNSRGIHYCKEAVFYFRRDVPASLSKRRDSDEVFEKWLFSYRSYVKEFHAHLEPDLARELSWKALSVFYCNAFPHARELRKQCLSEIRALGYRRAYAHGGETLVKVARWAGIDAALWLWQVKQGLRRAISR